MDRNQLIYRISLLIPLVLSLTVHEWAHAWSAYKLGDDTASRRGRLTLNPIPHIDPIGTILLPMLGIPFGWAKPVPVNPLRFDRRWSMRTGMAITAAAGPVSNFILAFICAVSLGLLMRFRPETFIATSLGQAPPAVALIQMGFVINVSLGIFNLLPIPPLDGSRILARYVPERLHAQWEKVERNGPMILMGVLVLSNVLGFSLIGRPMRAVMELFNKLVMLIAM